MRLTESGQQSWRTISIFASQGIYVFLDVHQDAFCSTNGGNGMPAWMGIEMQQTASFSCCATCGYGACGQGCERCSESCLASYAVSPTHPLASSIPRWAAKFLKSKVPGAHEPFVVEIEGEEDPWGPHSYDHKGGMDPRDMNIGNLSMRLNNNDAAWQRGTLLLSKQVQNIAARLWSSPSDVGRHVPAGKEGLPGDNSAGRRWAVGGDKAAFFDPYMTFVKHLCGVWAKHWNVVAVELFNEPPLGGLPNPFAALRMRHDVCCDAS